MKVTRKTNEIRLRVDKLCPKSPSSTAKYRKCVVTHFYLSVRYIEKRWGLGRKVDNKSITLVITSQRRSFAIVRVQVGRRRGRRASQLLRAHSHRKHLRKCPILLNPWLVGGSPSRLASVPWVFCAKQLNRSAEASIAAMGAWRDVHKPNAGAVPTRKPTSQHTPGPYTGTW